MSPIVYSSSLVAAFLGGVLALFAPCCIVSVLPTYTAAMLRRGRSRLVETTGVYALGVAVVLLPIVLGLGALGHVLTRVHSGLFVAGGLVMLGMGILALAGRHWMLPMPMGSATGHRGDGIRGIFVLGAISGVASSCCAPVLAGVLALSLAVASPLYALGLGWAYVLGMVAPLFVAAVLWERFHWDQGPLLRVGRVPVRLGPWQRQLSDVLAGTLFLLIAVGMLTVGLSGGNTITPPFLGAFDTWASTHLGVVVGGLSHLPAWVMGVALLLVTLRLVTWAWPRRQRQATQEAADSVSQPPTTAGLAHGTLSPAVSPDQVPEETA